MRIGRFCFTRYQAMYWGRNQRFGRFLLRWWWRLIGKFALNRRQALYCGPDQRPGWPLFRWWRRMVRPKV